MHKVEKQQSPHAQKAANFFGVLGYFSLLIEWAWVSCILLYPHLINGDLQWMLPASNPSPAAPMAPTPASPVTMLIGGIITLLCLGIVAYVIYTMPRAVGKSGAKITHKTAATVVPVITRHKKIPKKLMKRLTFNTILCLKLFAIIVPAIVATAIPSSPILDSSVVLIVTFFLAFWAFVNFSVQTLIAKIAKLDTELIW